MFPCQKKDPEKLDMLFLPDCVMLLCPAFQIIVFYYLAGEFFFCLTSRMHNDEN